MIKAFISALAAATLLAPAAAPALPIDPAHQAIVEAAAKAGVPVKLNTAMCEEHKGIAGYYNGAEMGICLRHGQWTLDDLDTLRHEAVHLTQDCLGDGRPNFIFNGRFTILSHEDVKRFAAETLTERELDHIVVSYHDADEQEILMELEAWSAAKAISPEVIAEAVTNACSLKK